MPEHPRPLLGLLVAQFFGAFNDNAFKMIVTLLAIRVAQQGITGETASEERISQQVTTTAAFVVFTLPLMLFSLPAMVLGDRVSKRTLILMAKTAEVLLMALGTYALATAPTGAHSRTGRARIDGRAERVLRAREVRHPAGAAAPRPAVRRQRTARAVELPGDHPGHGGRRSAPADRR